MRTSAFLASVLFLVMWEPGRAATVDTINGTVYDSMTNVPLDSVSVTSEGAAATTNAAGVFSLIIPSTSVIHPAALRTTAWRLDGHFLSWRGNTGSFSLEVKNLAGSMRTFYKSSEPSGRFSMDRLSPGIYVATIRHSRSAEVFKIVKVRIGMGAENHIVSSLPRAGKVMPSAAAGPAHVLVFKKTGYTLDTMTVPMNDLPSASITVKLTKAYALLFNGVNFDNWEHDGHFTIQDSAITGTGCWCMAFTKKDYGKYRFFVTARVKSPIVGPNRTGTGVMLGIEIWGKRHTGDYSPKGTIHIMPPLQWSWDYLHESQVRYTATVEKDPGFPMNAWNKVEILSDVQKGKFRMAVNGVEVLNFTATVPSDWSVGPIGLLNHNSDAVAQYKDIKIEEDPSNFDLVTLKP